MNAMMPPRCKHSGSLVIYTMYAKEDEIVCPGCESRLSLTFDNKIPDHPMSMEFWGKAEAYRQLDSILDGLLP